jgi:predicted lipid-binding transport protein (Tim44 family)
MPKKDLSMTGAMVGGMAGLVAEVTIQEITGHHITTGILELIGAIAGMVRLDRRLARSLKESLERAQDGQDHNYHEVKRRIEELTQDLPELREILGNMVDAGISAQQA